MNLLVLLLGIHLANAAATPTPVVQYSDEFYPDAMSTMNTMRHHENHAMGTPLPVEGSIVTPTVYPIFVSVTLTPQQFGTVSPNTVLLVRGRWTSTDGGRVRECNALATPGAEIENTEVHLTTKPDVTRAFWFMLVADASPVALYGMQRQSQ